MCVPILLQMTGFFACWLHAGRPLARIYWLRCVTSEVNKGVTVSPLFRPVLKKSCNPSALVP
jgi:hypothetical protein